MTTTQVRHAAHEPVFEPRRAGLSLADDLAQRLCTQPDGGDRQSVLATRAALEIIDRARAGTPEEARSGRAVWPWWEGPPEVLFLDEFLTRSELAALQNYVVARKSEFKPASLVNAKTSMAFVDHSFRLSETLFSIGPFRPLFEERVYHYLDFVCARLDLPGFARPTFELQITATRNGGFFRSHDDNSAPANTRRRLTFVYYFFVQPLAWSGGALRFAPRERWGLPLDIPPVQNRMIFFDPSLRHEVRPFVSGSNAFEAARFTVNGWVHQEQWP